MLKNSFNGMVMVMIKIEHFNILSINTKYSYSLKRQLDILKTALK